VEDCDQLRQLDISQCESDIQQFLVRFFEAGCDERALRRAVDEEGEGEEGPPGPPACIADELNRLFPEGPPVRPRELVEDCDQLRQLDISQCESDIQQFLVRFFEAGCDERALRNKGKGKGKSSRQPHHLWVLDRARERARLTRWMVNTYSTEPAPDARALFR